MTHLIKHDGKFYDDEDIEELIRLRAERLRFYHADGTFEALASPEEVTERRVACAKRIEELESLGEEMLRSFWDEGHPGRSCKRSGWIYDETIAAWRAILNRA